MSRWLILGLCTALALFFAVYPMYVIQPFAYQAERQLQWALQIRQWAPALTMLAALVAFLLLRQLWKVRRWWQRGLALLLTVLTLGAAIFARINIFERIFAPIDSLQYWSAQEARLESDDMVLAVRQAGQARAYSVRMMAYHHVVNDWLGGVPLVGTY